MPAGGNSRELLGAARAMAAPQAAPAAARDLGQGTAGTLHSHKDSPTGAGGEAGGCDELCPFSAPRGAKKVPKETRSGPGGGATKSARNAKALLAPAAVHPGPAANPNARRRGPKGGRVRPRPPSPTPLAQGGAATGAVLRGSQDGGQGGARRPRRCPAPLPGRAAAAPRSLRAAGR